MSLPETIKEDLWEERRVWVEAFGCSLADVLEDEEGEYILNEMENGNPGEEGYAVDHVTVRLPKHLQLFNINS